MAKRAFRAKPGSTQAPLKTPNVSPDQITIRMYKLAVGDCFLVTLPRNDGTPFRILIDCGIHMAAAGGKDLVRQAVQNIQAEVGGKLDVVVGTHEHWDHLSGFYHAADLFKSMHADKIWCAWTENMDDPMAKSLIGNRDQGVAALWGAVRRAGMAAPDGAEDGGLGSNGLFGFFGDSPGIGPKAKDAANAMRKLVTSEADIIYRSPGEPPFDDVSDQWRIFVLGPPRDKALLNRADPRPGSGEAYPLAAAELATACLASAVGEDDDPPFSQRYQIPLEETRAISFFRERYWNVSIPASANGEEDQQQDWRQIGNVWLSGAETLALALDKITNNTSLVLAIEFGPKAATDNPVILFAADAQVGNWLSWPDVRWPDYAGREVSGPDLLRRTVVYKVGHHASQNATLMEGGLETMRSLRLALVPTSADMAKLVKWGTLPWEKLLERLVTLTADRVLRSDTGASAGATGQAEISVADTGPYFDIGIPLGLKLQAGPSGR